MWISWKHEYSDFPGPHTFEQKVEVFYEQTLGWQLHIADLVANGGTTFGETKPQAPGYPVPALRHSAFAVLHICLSYFELIGSLVTPRSSRLPANQKFKAGVREVLPGLFNNSPHEDALLRCLYKGARCGLYHIGRPGLQVGVGSPSDGNPIAYYPQFDKVVLSPERLPVSLKSHLERFRLELLNPVNVALRENFKKHFDTGFS
jgi:hypothetical protein